jgi:hypothetical protein
MLFNVWNSWDPLKVVMLGNVHPIEFYRDLKDDKVRDPLCRITEETQKDLENFKNVLKDFGCKVIQMNPSTDENLFEYIENKKLAKQGIGIRNALQPRDAQLVLGNKLYITAPDNREILNQIKSYVNGKFEDLIIHPDIMKDKHYIPAPCITQVGKDLYIDLLWEEEKNDTCVIGFRLLGDGPEILMNGPITDWFKKVAPGYRYHEIEIGGHNDGCFCVLKPGALLTTTYFTKYEKSFPGWDVLELEENHAGFPANKQHIKDGKKIWGLPAHEAKKKHLVKVEGKWWIPGEEENDVLRHFVGKYLTDWVGDMQESIFDVNVLVLDKNTVCVPNKCDVAYEFYKKHKMEPIHVPFRHKWFWDAGLHCITLDLFRYGKQEDYFPEREEL